MTRERASTRNNNPPGWSLKLRDARSSSSQFQGTSQYGSPTNRTTMFVSGNRRTPEGLAGSTLKPNRFSRSLATPSHEPLTAIMRRRPSRRPGHRLPLLSPAPSPRPVPAVSVSSVAHRAGIPLSMLKPDPFSDTTTHSHRTKRHPARASHVSRVAAASQGPAPTSRPGRHRRVRCPHIPRGAKCTFQLRPMRRRRRPHQRGDAPFQ